MSESKYREELIKKTANKLLFNASGVLNYFYNIDVSEYENIKFIEGKNLLDEFSTFSKGSKVEDDNKTYLEKADEMKLIRLSVLGEEKERERQKVRTGIHSFAITASTFSAFLKLEGRGIEERFNTFSGAVAREASKLALEDAEKSGKSE